MKLIMVDLDGTLFDTRRTNYLAYKEAISKYGFKIDYKYYCNYCNGKHYTDFLPQITTNDQKKLEEIHKRKKLVYKSYLHEARINQPLVDLLKSLKNTYKIALVTTASKINANEILNRFGIIDIFDLILTQEDIIKNKPAPDGYLKAMNFFNVTPEDCIIFEDSNIGIEAAQASGSECLVVKGYN
jgi:beta-phosphoglucomutase